MPSIQTSVNLMPLGRAIVDKNGAATSEFWWFLNQLLQAVRGSQFLISLQTEFPVLDGSNANTFIFVPDYAHLIFWDGTTPQFADDGNDYYAIGQRSTNSPGWHLVDGTPNVPFLKPDGTLGTKNLLNAAAAETFLAGLSAADTLNPLNAGTVVTGLNVLTSKIWYRQ